MDVPSSKKSTRIHWFNVKEKSYRTITHYQCKWDTTWRLLKNNGYIWYENMLSELYTEARGIVFTCQHLKGGGQSLHLQANITSLFIY
jgi:hypothetical protein